MTTYERLRERSPRLAVVWAATEWCRIVSATVTFFAPLVVLVFVTFEAFRQSVGHVIRLFGEWQLYAALFAMTVIPLVVWCFCEWLTARIIGILPELPERVEE